MAPSGRGPAPAASQPRQPAATSGRPASAAPVAAAAAGLSKAFQAKAAINDDDDGEMISEDVQ